MAQLLRASLAGAAAGVVLGAGAGVAAVLPLGRWLRGLVLLVASSPLLLFGSAFTLGEVGEVRDHNLDPPSGPGSSWPSPP